VYLFALPFLAYFAATACIPARGEPPHWEPFVALTLSAALLAAFLFGYFGKEQWTHFTRGEVRAVEQLYAHVKSNSLVVHGTANYPIGAEKIEDVTYVEITSEPEPSRERLLADPRGVLERWLGDEDRYSRGFVIITRAQKAQSDALGLLPPGTLDRIEVSLLTSSRFVTLYHDRDASLFTLAPPPMNGPR
jgi:hypothetical protein